MTPADPLPPCIDCGEPDAGCPGDRCRECDMDHVVAETTCRECLQWIIREEYGGPRALQHRDGCGLRDAEDYYPRTAEEMAAVRGRVGT